MALRSYQQRSLVRERKRRAHIAPGEKFEIVVGKDFSGDKVTGWVFSDPFKLGAFTVKVNGWIALRLLADVPLGSHRIAVYDAKGDLIGWQLDWLAECEDRETNCRWCERHAGFEFGRFA